MGTTRAARVQVDLSAVPASRLSALARYGLTAKARCCRSWPIRAATLLAAARHLEATAVDGALRTSKSSARGPAAARPWRQKIVKQNGPGPSSG